MGGLGGAAQRAGSMFSHSSQLEGLRYLSGCDGGAQLHAAHGPRSAGEPPKHFLNPRAHRWVFMGHPVDQVLHEFEVTVFLNGKQDQSRKLVVQK
jgi:hypothetical protein